MAVYTSGFDFETTEEEIMQHFAVCGTVSGVDLVGKGAAVVRYADPASATQAVQDLNESTIPGNRRYVNVRMDGKGKKGGGKGKKGGGKGYGDSGKGYGDSGKGYGDSGKGYRDSGKGGRFDEGAAFDGELQEGTVARFISDRGFGYITPDAGEKDIFVHFSSIQGSGFRELQEGQRVSFGVEPDPKGKGKGSVRAVAVSIL
eukprot:CAMPEP_0197873004 /NCGR_PEP_ID=MMETSP1439-20131203/2941_1 /TAXON_ID=66791 /ORGANISM="Gonyaulax spinifera, Strain CCMP409" /LENGTH=201 /DNA_ID=CAMNT_0043492035 /DNA_START=97 /DNA_END=702 /DNA_ORIENTATION=-